MTTATLTTRVVLNWTNRNGCDRDCEVEAEYTFDGDDLRITASTVVGHCDLGDHAFDELLWQAVNEVADQEYAEALADRDFDDSLELAA